MRFIDRKSKYDYLIELINKQATGSPNELAIKICVSRRTLLRYIADLRDAGFVIGYCSYRRSYYLVK